MHPRCQLAWYLLTIQNFDTSREVGSWWCQVLHLTGAGRSGLSCKMLSADGTAVKEVLFSTHSLDLSALPCTMIELMGNK